MHTHVLVVNTCCFAKSKGNTPNYISTKLYLGFIYLVDIISLKLQFVRHTFHKNKLTLNFIQIFVLAITCNKEQYENLIAVCYCSIKLYTCVFGIYSSETTQPYVNKWIYAQSNKCFISCKYKHYEWIVWQHNGRNNKNLSVYMKSIV